MCSIKVTLNVPDGSQQTFFRSAEQSGKDGKSDGSVSDLAILHKQMVEVQSEVNAALTVLVDKEKAASAAEGKQQSRKATEDQEEDEDDDDDDDDDSIQANGSGEPPEKRQKLS